MPALVEVANTGHVLTLTLCRPDKKNALTDGMYGALADALEQAGADPSTRCVVITGAGDVFTSGNDLGDFATVAAGTRVGEAMQVHRFLDRLATFDKPLIAAVPGLAIGIGTTLLLHCDLVFLAENAVLAVPFIDLALVPEAASSLLLQARIGYVRAFAMFALGERIEAHKAVEWGLANRVIPLDRLQSHAAEVAAGLASKPPGALIATKRLMRDAEAIQSRLTAESIEFGTRLKSPEAREAFTAFAERRKPDFSGF